MSFTHPCSLNELRPESDVTSKSPVQRCVRAAESFGRCDRPLREVKNRSLAEKTILKAMTKAGHDAQKDWEAHVAPAHGGPGVDLRELDGQVCCGQPADLPCRRQLLEDKKSVSVAVLCSHPLLTGHPCLALFG